MNKSLSTITINIGKSGVNENISEEIKRQLKSYEVVKLRFAKGIADKKEYYTDKIVTSTKSKIVDLRGNVVVIYKKGSS
ncbi:MAG: YhbY family RNA-binding protein [Methanobrevibacter sp.]|jgi:RNA-binding protein|nr:YhbY family RNA-binding protein [Candidatus Methanovirga aequatorialis]